MTQSHNSPGARDSYDQKTREAEIWLKAFLLGKDKHALPSPIPFVHPSPTYLSAHSLHTHLHTQFPGSLLKEYDVNNGRRIIDMIVRL